VSAGIRKEKLVLNCSKAFCSLIVFLSIGLTSTQAQTAERLIVLEGTSASAHIFDPTSNTDLATISVGATPSAVVFSPNGRMAFVANLNSKFVSVIDLTINAEIKRIRNVRAFYMAITADGSQVVATDPVNEQIYVIDANTLSLSRTISLNGLLGDDPNSNDLGFNNLTIAANKVYINSSLAIGVVNLATSAVSTVSTPLGARTFSGSESIAATADGQYVLAVRAGGTVIINPADDSVIQTASYSGFSIAASGPASAANHSYAYLINRIAGNPAFNIVDMNTGSSTFGQIIASATLPAALPLNNGTRVSSSLDGTRAYVTVQTRNNPNLLVIDTNAVFSNPAAAITAQLQVGVLARASSSGLVQTQPDANAPVVSSVSAPLVTNDASSTVTISGSGFAPGAQVRIGSLDPVNAQAVSSTSLQVTIPQDAPAQGAAIIVTNPNQESGILRGAFVIASKPAFQPANQVGVTNFADSTFSVLNVSTNATVSPATATAASPMGIAITPDGARAYI
jgi:IPT/TIG domain/Cytochrome D1 heme domain